MTRSCIVLGGTGYIGKRLIPTLIERGWKVRVLVHQREVPLPPGTEIFRGDIRDGLGPEALEGVSAILCLVGRGVSRHSLDRNLDVAVAKALGRSLKNGAELRLVFLSSILAVGPAQEGEQLREDAPSPPVTRHGWAKRRAEEILRDTGPEVRVVILRSPPVYGPEDRLASTFFRWAGRGRFPVFSTALSLIYVDDVVQALLKSLDADVQGDVFFISDGRRHTFGEIAKNVHHVTGLSFRTMNLDGLRRAFRLIGPLCPDFIKPLCTGDWVCSIERAQAGLGYQPSVQLAEGLERSWRGR